MNRKKNFVDNWERWMGLKLWIEEEVGRCGDGVQVIYTESQTNKQTKKEVRENFNGRKPGRVRLREWHESNLGYV